MAPLSGEAQEYPGVGIGMVRDHFPVFRLHEGHFPDSSAYTLALSYYDPDFAQAEFKLHHTRGYDPSISYSYGFSAAWVAPLSEELLFKAGLGLDGYKLKDRKCQSFIVSLLKAFFIFGDVCQEDDIHASFNPFAAIE